MRDFDLQSWGDVLLESSSKLNIEKISRVVKRES